MTAVTGEPLAPARRAMPWSRTRTKGEGRPLRLRTQLALQALCLFITATVLLPLLWVVSLAVDPSNALRPTSLIPSGATLNNFIDVLNQPTSNPISFWELAKNSFILAATSATISVLLAVTAAYAFSRLRFRGRTILMLGILSVLMLPAVVSIVPLFIQLNQIRIGDFNL